MTPIIAAALARTPRRNPRSVQQPGGRVGAKKPPHNFLSQAPKRKAGAALGNRHAARRDDGHVERLAAIDELVRTMSALARAWEAAAGQAGQERARLAALLAGPQP